MQYLSVTPNQKGIIPFRLVEIWINGERFTAAAMIFPFRVGQVLCFGAWEMLAATEYTTRNSSL